MNLKSGRIEGFEQYSQFTSLKEFNTHVEMWLAVKKGDFPKGELVALKRLVRFSAKIPGVSNAKIGTILFGSWLKKCHIVAKCPLTTYIYEKKMGIVSF